MKIQDGLNLLKKEIALKRTTRGRIINDYAVKTIQTVLEDNKNYQSDLAQCLGCGFVNSILLFETGCPNCNVIDIKADLKEGEI